MALTDGSPQLYLGRRCLGRQLLGPESLVPNVEVQATAVYVILALRFPAAQLFQTQKQTDRKYREPICTGTAYELSPELRVSSSRSLFHPSFMLLCGGNGAGRTSSRNSVWGR